MITFQAVDIAVAWWIAALRGGRQFDNGETRNAAGALASLIVDREPEPNYDALAEALRARLVTAVRQTNGFVTLRVDYYPEGLLAEAARAVGFRTMRWPWKTTMHLGPMGVHVTAGYRAESECLWSDPEATHRMYHTPTCTDPCTCGSADSIAVHYDRDGAPAPGMCDANGPNSTYCTRAKSHEDDHVCGRPLIGVVARWPQA